MKAKTRVKRNRRGRKFARWILGCYGLSPLTGLRVGARHSWPDGWGKGRCRFCGRTLDDLK